jgi:zinc protease
LFFDRYYRPQYTTIIVAGDVSPERVRPLAQKYWGNWKRGDYQPPIPAEPPQRGPRANQIQWPTPTLPWVVVSFHGPAYSDQQKEQAALDLISFLGFSESSALYQKLVIQEQKVDTLQADSPDRVDPYLFSVWARLKKPADLESVRQDILATLESFKGKPVAAERLDEVKRHLRYSFALSLNNSETIAGLVARFVALRRTPETINRLYDLYEQITPEDIRSVARKYLIESGRTIVTLTGGKAQ